ncbi:MAG: hypothetical protein HUU20_07010 [Pirellulales bacterium]|nr:hypothetical protein [Pirellulales bacterium]
MAESKRKPAPQGIRPPADDDDVYAIRVPVESAQVNVDRKIEEILARHQRLPDPADEMPPPPATFLSGVLRFPWYLQSLTPWIFCSFGLALSFLGVVLAFWLADHGLTMAAYAMRFSICWVIVFSLSYLSGCFLAIIEGTAGGYDEITDWPKGDWRDYFFSLGYPVGMLVLAALVGTAAYWLTFRQSYAVPVVVGFLVYPFFLLSAMESGSVLGFISRPILRTCIDLWWGWIIVYTITAAMFAGWLAWALYFFPYEGFFTAGVSGPILAAILFIYARLLGRLAWWAQKVAEEENHELL